MKQNFGDVEAAATAWRKLGTEAETRQSAHRHSVTGALHHGGWKGPAADSALPLLEGDERRLGMVALEATAIAVTLTRVQAQMESAQSQLRAAVSEAEAAGHQVSDDGQVTAPTLDPRGRNDPDFDDIERRNRGQAREFQERITKAVNDAQQASGDGAAALAQLRGDILTAPRPSNGRSALAEATADAKLVREKFALFPSLDSGATPAENKQWWDGLSPEMQRQYLILDPDAIANRDGVPTDIRDLANRHVLDRELDKMYSVGYPDKEKFDKDSWNTREEGLRELRDRLDKADGAPKGREMYLIGLDPKGDGRAVVSVGNPDTAKNTTVYVPGTESALKAMSNPGDDLDRTDRLVQASERYGNPGDTAAVLWLGYDAPDTAWADAEFDHYAEDAAPALDRYMDSLGATHEPGPRHTSILGHSYGSTVIGETIKRGDGLPVDDIIVAGSPGMHVQHAKDLKIDPNHVWAAEAMNDPVPDLGVGKHGEGGWFDLPNHPTSPDFGANEFKTGTADGHSEYWEFDGPNVPNESLDNQARIITGRYSEVTKHRTAHS
ncbi:alpha/beta hydrolase [Streptomyces sp. CB03911]|nr:alpha/beta hydrolase [Streptomyces sp. CB03911]